MASKAAPLRLAALRHGLDLDLDVTIQDRRAGLLLTVREGDKTRHQFVPVDNLATWHEVRLAWQAGQYALAVDGQVVAGGKVLSADEIKSIIQ